MEKDIKQIISEMVEHINRQNIHNLIDTLDDNSLREIIQKMLEDICELKKVK